MLREIFGAWLMLNFPKKKKNNSTHLKYFNVEGPKLKRRQVWGLGMETGVTRHEKLASAREASVFLKQCVR
jgi:hypothetical protein